MALIADYTCSRCNKTTYGLVPPDHSRLCPDCAKADREESLKARRVYLAGLTGLTTEERLAKIEAYIYDTDAAARLKALEASNVTY